MGLLHDVLHVVVVDSLSAMTMEEAYGEEAEVVVDDDGQDREDLCQG